MKTFTLLILAVVIICCKAEAESENGWAADHCPSTYVAIGHDCYYISQDKLSWYDAVQSCIEKEGQLVSFSKDIKLKMAMMTTYLKKHNNDVENYWTSGTDDDEEGLWIWHSLSQPVEDKNHKWCPGHPDKDDKLNCMAVKRDQKCWTDYSCDDDEKHYICEK